MNLFGDLPDTRSGEITETLIERPGLRIERIVSHGERSRPDFWYDQDETEWVVVLAGQARLRFADEAEDRVLGPGDYLLIKPHRRHRVEWSDPATPTIWLAIFWNAGQEEEDKPCGTAPTAS